MDASQPIATCIGLLPCMWIAWPCHRTPGSVRGQLPDQQVNADPVLSLASTHFGRQLSGNGSVGDEKSDFFLL